MELTGRAEFLVELLLALIAARIRELLSFNCSVMPRRSNQYMDELSNHLDVLILILSILIFSVKPLVITLLTQFRLLQVSLIHVTIIPSLSPDSVIPLNLHIILNIRLALKLA